ncbi:MAG: GNAT family N-acetyltransferase [Chloroflexota bacterium]
MEEERTPHRLDPLGLFSRGLPPLLDPLGIFRPGEEQSYRIHNELRYRVEEWERTPSTVDGRIVARDFGAPLPEVFRENMELWAPAVGQIDYEVVVLAKKKVGRIGGVAVIPEYRKSGVGKRLVQLAEKQMKTHGALTAIGSARDEVREFWEKMGYVFRDTTMRKELMRP